MFREPFGARDETASLPDTPAAPAATVVQHSCQWHVPRGRALVMAGGCCRDEALAAERLARRLGCPFLADVSTGLRGLSYDLQLMRDDTPAADVILHVGGRVVSKRWLQYVDAHPPQHYLRLTPHADRLDPLHRVTQVLRGPIEPLCDGARISELSCPDFLQAWLAGSERCRRAAEAILDHQTTVNEPAIARAIAADLPRGSGLLLGNSMPIREMDMFGWWETSREVQVAANRGASGIDGLIATSAGLAAGLQRPTTALIGDLAALHDLNSLALLATSPVPVVLVVVNNDGGGIFHFLPVASQTQSFERFFATPHGRNFQCAARMFDLAYEHPASLAEFTAAYRRAINRVASSVIEVRTDRAANRVLHREIEQAVRGATA
jgi:2-succinyl-5-enolpyruvyl-6-hydroxy-3-cyclohexene-1-carboxylate synthase